MPPNSDFPTAPEMKVNWRYVLANGTVVATAPASGAIGRFAYWVDTENSRANINTAGFGMTQFNSALTSWVSGLLTTNPDLVSYQQNVWLPNPWATDSVGVQADGTLSFSALDRSAAQSRTLQNLTGHPSSVDLDYMDGISVEESFNTFRYAGSYFLRADAKNATLKSALTGGVPDYWISQNPDLSVRVFNAPEDWKQVVGDDSFQKNKAYITTRARSPEITPWGTPKMSLSLAANYDNTLNVLSEDFQRNIDPNSLIRGLKDTRMTLVPYVRDSGTGRNLIRELGGFTNPYNNQTNNSTIQSSLAGIKALFDTQVPGYSSLSSKYGSNGTEQTVSEILSFADQTLNAIAPGFPAYNRYWNEPEPSPPLLGGNATKQLFGGRLIPMLKGSTTRRLGTYGPYLPNEIGIQLESTSFSIPVAPTSTIVTPAAIWRDAYNGPPPPETTYPYAVLSPTNYNPSTVTTAGPVWCFILRQPLTNIATGNVTTNRDRWVRVTIREELVCPPNWGFAQKLGLGQGPRIYLSDVVLDYSTNDPTYAGSNAGSRRAYFDSTRDGNTSSNNALPSSGSYVAKSPSFPLLSPSTSTHHEATRITNGGILVGPFRPGSIVTLRLKLRLINKNQIWGDFIGSDSPVPGATAASALWHAVPGIFRNYDVTAMTRYSDPSDESQAEMLEFNVNNFSADTIIPSTISYEADDPRLSRRRSGLRLTTNHSFGAENSNFTGNLNGQASDLSMPNSLLQMVRGTIRARAVGGAWGDPNGNSERQNSSRILGLPGVGSLSSIPTGIESNTPWQTMKFHANSDTVPDWLLWNMFFVPFDRSIANQTDGKININATLHPFGIKRTRPLQALLADRVSNAPAVASNIANRTLGAGASALVGPSDLYVYGGQVCQIAGVADSGANEYEKEKVTRGIADLVTTQSNDFRVFVVAQSIRQTPDGKIIPMATQRMEASLSRTFDDGGRGYPFNSIFPSNVVERGGYTTNPSAPAFLDLNNPATLPSKGRNFSGADGIINTADDWLVPHKIEITRCRILP
jgi:hypothetical protein